MKYVDLFLLKVPGVGIEAFQLVGIAALFMSIKLNERCILSLEQCAMECNYIYQPAQIEKCEMAILHLALEWKVDTPTPHDFIQYFLYIANSGFDFGNIINDILRFTYIGLLGKFKYSN